MPVISTAAKTEATYPLRPQAPNTSPLSASPTHRFIIRCSGETGSVLFGETSLRCVLREHITYFHQERDHRGKGNLLLFPSNQEPTSCRDGPV
jgi:hypothetical protein